jgi:16S rRNA (cytosine967-C5)-methyltransferase
VPDAARAVALLALKRWRTSREFANDVIHPLLAEAKMSNRDRGFAQELFYGVLRHLTLLDFYISRLCKSRPDATARDFLRLGLYQLLKLGTPEHAAVFETVQLAPPKRRPFINGVLHNASRLRYKLESAAAAAPLHVRESHPEFLLQRWRRSFLDEAVSALAHWNNQPPRLYARINTLTISPAEFAQKYPEFHPLPQHPLFGLCDYLPQTALERGHCYVQDPSTARCVELLQPAVNDTILDACAAPGGKTAYICALTENRARVVACELEAERVERLRANLARAAATNVIATQHDWERGPLESELFDKILLDAPCTNTGVMRRRADVRWRLQPQEFARMHERQCAIARAVVPLLKSGGVFVYSTCSLEPEENEGVVEQISREFPNLKLEKIESVLPFRDGFDGAFAARFVS